MPYSNDNYADAIELVGASGAITPFFYDGVGDPATHEAGEIYPSFYTGNGQTLWWKWTAPYTGTAYFTTDGSPADDGRAGGLDTILSAFEGGFDEAHRLAYNDDGGPRLQSGYFSNSYINGVVVTAGHTYYVQLDQNEINQQGTVHLLWDYLFIEGTSSGGGAGWVVGSPAWA